MNYVALVKDADGVPVSNSDVDVRISIVDYTDETTVYYSESQRKDGIKIIECVLSESPNFFDQVSEDSSSYKGEIKINGNLLVKMVDWDTKTKVLSAKELQYVADFAHGFKKLNDFHEKNIKRHLSRLQDAGFGF